jgi:hypothetical protein
VQLVDVGLYGSTRPARARSSPRFLPRP